MIARPFTFTLLCVLTAAGLAWNLFQVKHRASQLDRELASVAEQIRAVQKHKETLESVWGTLNDLPRLRQLSQQQLPMETSQTPQNRSFAELERRLPPAQPFNGTRSAFAPRDGVSPPNLAIALLPPEPASPRLLLAVATPAASALHPAMLLAPTGLAPAVPVPAPLAPALLTETDALPLPPPPPPLPALTEARGMPFAGSSAGPRPIGPPVPPPRPAQLAAAAPTAHARPPAPRTIPTPVPVTAEAPARSMLGGLGGPLLAPPVPYGSAQAASLGGYSR